jgi:drug/metabolite transporter (DMT)-like permease
MPQFALLLTTLVWGATFPATKVVLDQIPPLSFLFLRFLLGTLCSVGILALARRELRLDSLTLTRSAIATVWLFLGYTLQTAGLLYTTASNSAFITALYVVFVPLFLGRFDVRIWVSAALAIVGLWFLINPSVAINAGDVMTLGCAAAFGAHIACLERYTREGDPVSFFVWQMIMVAGLMVPAMLIESPPASAFQPTALLLMALIVTGILATGAFAVQIWAQRLLPAQRVALIFSLEPAYAAWLSWYFLGERMDATAWLGSGLIFAAVLIGAIAPPAEKLPPAAETGAVA